MIILREAKDTDIGGLDRLSAIAAEKHPGFLNVPSDPENWREKIHFSKLSFNSQLRKDQIGKYIFVAEDTETKNIVGVSMISAQHGTPDSPHFYFQVGSESKFSPTINTGFIHGTLSLKIDSDGPTEIGGLLVDPSARNQDVKIGRQISFIRFLYIGMNRSKFKNKILAELLPPLTKKGKSPLWEAVGRRFTNMDYWEADYLSSKNKEFIFSLFPSGIVYVTFLPADARNSIGKVSKDTDPVMHMLKKIGFKYENQVDPFDGGPHLQANTDDLTPIRNIHGAKYAGVTTSDLELFETGIIVKDGVRPFQAVSAKFRFKDGKLYLFDKEVEKVLDLKDGDAVHSMPFY